MQRLRTVTLLDVSAVAGHHAMPAALLFVGVIVVVFNSVCIMAPVLTFYTLTRSLRNLNIGMALK